MGSWRVLAGCGWYGEVLILVETIRRGKGLEKGEFCWREGAVERDPGEGGMGGWAWVGGCSGGP